MKFGIAKLSKAIKFNRKNWNPHGGDNEALALIQALSNNYPEHQFYIMSPSDYERLPTEQRALLFPRNNVINMWTHYNSKDKEDLKRDTHLLDYPEKLDRVIIMPGPSSTASIRGKTRLVTDQSKFVSPMVVSIMYLIPIIRYLNETDTPFIEVNTDQAYDLRRIRDLIRDPMQSLGQYDHSYDHRHIVSYDDQTHVKSVIETKYAPIETLFCVNRTYPENLSKKTRDFVVVANERHISRYPMLDEWILSQFSKDEVSIYGKWDEREDGKTLFGDPRYQGSLHIDALHQVMSETKVTFVVPQHKGGVTSKWVEMLHSGVVPIFHPSYDTQGHIKIPERLRPKNPSELKDLVKSLIEDDIGRVALIEQMKKDLLLPSFYDGSLVSKLVIESFIKG